MRDFMPTDAIAARPRRTGPARAMRERRTAQVLMVFGVILACVELYIVLGWM